MEMKFKPFERIIYKEKLFDGCRWHCAFFSDYNESNGCVNFADGKHYHFTKIDILPYEGNEELVGTDQNPDEEVRLEEGEWIIVSSGIWNNPTFWLFAQYVKSSHTEHFLTNMGAYIYAIRFSDFNPNDMEETKKHILCVKDGKIIRYKG